MGESRRWRLFRLSVKENSSHYQKLRPPVLADGSYDVSGVVAVIAAIGLGRLIAFPVAGPLSDRLGRRQPAHPHRRLPHRQGLADRGYPLPHRQMPSGRGGPALRHGGGRSAAEEPVARRRYPGYRLHAPCPADPRQCSPCHRGRPGSRIADLTLRGHGASPAENAPGLPEIR